VPHPSVILRLVGFAVAAGLAMAGIQPLVAATTGAVDLRWAVGLTAPALITAGLLLGAGRISDRGDKVQPPWYSAWLLLPGSFLLAGAAAMCIFGALVQFSLIPRKPLPLTGAPGYVSGWALGVAARVSRSRIPLRPRSMARTPSSFLNPLFAPPSRLSSSQASCSGSTPASISPAS